MCGTFFRNIFTYSCISLLINWRFKLRFQFTYARTAGTDFRRPRATFSCPGCASTRTWQPRPGTMRLIPVTHTVPICCVSMTRFSASVIWTGPCHSCRIKLYSTRSDMQLISSQVRRLLAMRHCCLLLLFVIVWFCDSVRDCNWFVIVWFCERLWLVCDCLILWEICGYCL